MIPPLKVSEQSIRADIHNFTCSTNTTLLRYLLVAISILCFVLPPKARSQEIKTTRDIGVWAGVAFEKKLAKKWKASIGQEFRSFDNAAKLDRAITDLGLAYTINKKFKLEAGGRYAYARTSDRTFINNLRYNVDFKYKIKLVKHLSLTYRFRFQHNFNNLLLRPSESRERRNVRNRIKARYKFEKHTVFFAAEIFRQHALYRKPYFNQVRFNLGDEISTKFGDFRYALASERELNEEAPLTFFFLKLNYSIPLKRD